VAALESNTQAITALTVTLEKRPCLLEKI